MARKVSVRVDRKLCAGCGACESRLSTVFILKGDRSSVSYPIQSESDELFRTAENCPNKAIALKIISRW
jgi:ferredoxin